jgi:hypothetical protein
MNAPTATEKLTTAIMPNDIVKHRPSGEEWVVCGVNYRNGELIPCGYPFPSIAKIEDCDLIEKRYDTMHQTEEQIKALQKDGMDSFVDVDSAMLKLAGTRTKARGRN